MQLLTKLITTFTEIIKNMNILTFLSFLIISVSGFVFGLILNDPLLMALSWFSSVLFFFFTILDAFGLINADF
jgi:hypothetical protein